MSKIILATNNNHKIQEISAILNPLGIEVLSQLDAGISVNPEENGLTFEENAAIKARAVRKYAECSVIADDSGLEVLYLGNAPGIYSSRYAGPDADDKQRCKKILDELDGVPVEKRSAKFVCAICLIDESGKEHFFRGECGGYIGFEPKGDNGFGYDPIFMIGNQSFAEISSAEKNRMSHRAAALVKLKEFIFEKAGI